MHDDILFILNTYLPTLSFDFACFVYACLLVKSTNLGKHLETLDEV